MSIMDEDDFVEGNTTVEDSANQDEVLDEPTKKRKRDTVPEEELEIDINLPEPPSKKALRRAKKAKGGIDVAEAPASTPAASTPENKDVPAKPSRSIWIGNLPFTTTKAMLRTFFTSSSATPIPDEAITRIHLPQPANAKATKTQLKPVNKGFAYVDLGSQEAFETALAMSETAYGGRKVLIKDAKDFAGRPDPKATPGAKDANGKKDAGGTTKQPSRRVFVGNLGFDVTKEDLQEHFEKCGEVESLHLATFEDTGKCKGFGWVTFAAEQTLPDLKSVGVEKGEDAAGAAVKGFTWVPQEAQGTSESEDDEVVEVMDEDLDQGAEGEPKTTARKRQKKKLKPRKWFVNRLKGRPLRCEFAEDPTTRYKKRFGKDPQDKSRGDSTTGLRPVDGDTAGEVNGAEAISSVGRPVKQARKRAPNTEAPEGIYPGAPTDASKRRGGRTSKAAAADVRYRTGALIDAEGLGEGKKVTFD